jgi:hypothetical protein
VNEFWFEDLAGAACASFMNLKKFAGAFEKID